MLNATELVVLIDRSGSMDSCKYEAEQAVNEFIKTQAEDGSLTYLTLAQFNNKTSVDISAQTLDKDKLPKYVLYPSGMTALYDAVGSLADITGKRLTSLPEDKRPDKVVFVVMTDGHENSSKEFTASKIKEIITHQESVYNWKFIYLGANQDAFAVGSVMGANASRTSSYDTKHFMQACSATSEAVSNYKLSRSVDLEYNDSQRGKIKGDPNV